MDEFTAQRRRRPHDQLSWQQLRDSQLRDIQRLRQEPPTPREYIAPRNAIELRLWIAVQQYNEQVSLREKMLRTPSSVGTKYPGIEGEWSQSDISYMAAAAREAQAAGVAAGRARAGDAAALAAACSVLLLLTLAALLETCGFRIMPRRCLRKTRQDVDEPFTATIEPPPVADPPPPYTASAGAAAAGSGEPPSIANYTPLANERPPPAYSEIFVQIPDLKVFYTSEMQAAAIDGYERDSFNDEVNETVMNYTLEHARNVGNVEETADARSTSRGDIVVV